MGDYDLSWLRAATRCEKTPYNSRAEAERALRAIASAPNRSEFAPVRVYQCGCKKWHLTARKSLKAMR